MGTWQNRGAWSNREAGMGGSPVPGQDIPAPNAPSSTDFGAASSPGEFLYQALCSELPRQLGRGALGALQRWVALGKKQRALGAEREVPGDGLEERHSPKPHAHVALSASARDGHPSPRAPRARDRLSTASPAPHHRRAKTGAFGAA